MQERYKPFAKIFHKVNENKSHYLNEEGKRTARGITYVGEVYFKVSLAVLYRKQTKDHPPSSKKNENTFIVMQFVFCRTVVIPVANLPPVPLIPAAICHRCLWDLDTAVGASPNL
jgi:hypothetical protein